MHPKFIIVSNPHEPRRGRLVYGMVGSHRDLIEGYVKVCGGGWYEKDDERKTMTLYGSSGDFGEPQLDNLRIIPGELRDYAFFYSPDWGKTSFPLELHLEDA